MIKLVAILPASSYAPEIYNLATYLESKPGISLTLVSHDVSELNHNDFDAMYIKMGFAPKWRQSAMPEIHDYASASTGPFGRIKDAAKTHLSRRPVLRTFLSEYVRNSFRFRDATPHIVRDMGVPDTFLEAAHHRSAMPEFDLFYAGSITESRESADLLRAAEKARLKLLIAGKPQKRIYDAFRESAYVTFAGVVDHASIPELAVRCRLGINLTPDVRPYNRQTSTKVIEYLALGMPVVTNDYQWIQDFEAVSGARMLRLSGVDQLTPDILEFDYHVPDMSEYRWERIFDDSKIYQHLLRVL